MWADPVAFAQSLLARGIEIVVIGRDRTRLWVWPGQAKKYFTPEERADRDAHRDELLEIAAAKVLPETTVKWQRPTATATTPPTPDTTPAAEAAACPYCAPHPCVGEGSPYYPTLHWHDPREEARRSAAATRVMFASLQRQR